MDGSDQRSIMINYNKEFFEAIIKSSFEDYFVGHVIKGSY